MLFEVVYVISGNVTDTVDIDLYHRTALSSDMLLLNFIAFKFPIQGTVYLK